MIPPIIISKTADFVYDEVKDLIKKRHKRELKSTKVDFEQALHLHLNTVINWASEISFKDLKKSKTLSQVYIDLDLFLTPKKRQYFEEESLEKISIKEIFKNAEKHIVLLGQLGAGKTTSLKKICIDLIENQEFGETFFQFPIVIRINELSNPVGFSIFKKLFSIFNLKLEAIKDENEDIYRKIILPILNSINALVIIDGYDEIPDFVNKELVTKELRELAFGLSNSRLILTSRSGEFTINIERSTVFELCPLDRIQIKTFANRWFTNANTADSFLKDVNATTYADTLNRPIFISLLCSIYERLGKVPDLPKTVYRKIVSLLLEEWDEQRSIKRASRYAHLDIDRKIEFLSHLAFYMTTEVGVSVFDRQTVKMFYKKVCSKYDLPPDQYFQVIEELESHHGIFIQDGYDRFKFYHKSMQEYLTADYVLKLPSIPANINLLLKLPNELAIATALSSNPADYITELVLGTLKERLDNGFIRPFISRLYIEKPFFESNYYIAIVFILLYNKLISSGQQDTYATKSMKTFLTSKSFFKSFEELKKNSNFKELSKSGKYLIYHYTDFGNDIYDLSYLYNNYLKLDKRFTK